MDILIAAKCLIQNPEAWTQNKFARDMYWEPVETESDEACKFCAMGAISRIYLKNNLTLKDYEFARSALQNAAWQLKRVSAVEINDFYQHGDVMEMFDIAIKNC